MRKKLSQEAKRSKLIGIKVQQKTKEQLEYIAGREDTTLSTVINTILIEYIENYFKIAKIQWESIPEEEKTYRER